MEAAFMFDDLFLQKSHADLKWRYLNVLRHLSLAQDLN